MSKIKIGAQVTAKVCPTKVTVSGTFQGYELQDKEDSTSVCGKVFYVKDGMQYLDFVYVDSIKACDIEDERIRKFLVKHVSEWIGCIEHDLKISSKDVESEEELAMFKAGLAYLEKQKEQKPISSCDIVPYIDEKIAALQDMWREEKVSFDWDDMKDMIEDVARHFYHKEQKPSTGIYWHAIKRGDKIPCRAYLYKVAYETENNFGRRATIDGLLVPNIENVTCGCDTWYLPADDVKNLPREGLDELHKEQKPREYTLSLVKKIADGEMLTCVEQMAMGTLYEQLKKL